MTCLIVYKKLVPTPIIFVIHVVAIRVDEEEDRPRPVTRRATAAFGTMTSMVATHQPISPLAAARYQERWAIARKRLNEELRATSMETKLRQLANLMRSAREMGWSQSLDEEDDAVRGRWMALRRARLGKA